MLTIFGFPYSLLPVSCGEIGFLKSIDQVLALEKKCLYHASRLLLILMSDLVRCSSPLHIMMAILGTFFKI
jgi:hypothetical protein